MVTFLVRLHTPVHPRRKVILKLGPPSPGSGTGTGLLSHRILRIIIIGQLWDKSSSPTSVFRPGRITETVGKEIKPGWRIPFFKGPVGIGLGAGFWRI